MTPGRLRALSALLTIVAGAAVVPASLLAQDASDAGAVSANVGPTGSADRSNGDPGEAGHELAANRDIADIEIDGRLDEPDWAGARVFTGFTQGEPVEGVPADEDTEVRVLFGDGAMWIAARMWDSDPERIVDRLARRDSHGQFDLFIVQVDPNMDRLTGYSFTVSAANVQGDMYLFDDDKADPAWDAVWASAVQKDDQGWTAELRIPLSQIRYEASDVPQTWGINFTRYRTAGAEWSYHSLVSRLQQGVASQMGRMEGVLVDRPSRRLEVLPYAVSNFHDGPSTPGDPYFDGSSADGRVGLDLSYGLGAAFTLDATINPDFGQVEADPAVVNLTAFETFFEERRPFFVEDARVFDFNLSGGRNQLFYSRRVGRSPHGGAPSDAEFSSIPDHSTILGAAKVSGRTAGGLSIGALGAVTGEEFGKGVFRDGSESDFMVEPRAQYGVLSLGQDLGDGTTQFSGIVTGMRRDLPGDGSYDWLPTSAFNGGVRFEHQWAERSWSLWGVLGVSHVLGDEEAITRIQKASNHYYQRPDATRFRVDETATSISGANWRLQLDKRSGDHWTGGIWAAEVTKGFEINDLGFSTTAERLDGGMRVGYREIRPGSLFRNYSVTLSTFHNWSHEALDDVWTIDSWHDARLRGSYSMNTSWELLSYWSVRANGSYSPRSMSRAATRGGPVMVNPASTNASLNVSSDRRNAVSFGSNISRRDDRTGPGGELTISGDVRMQSDNIALSLSPRWERSTANEQYVSSTSTLPYDPTFGRRYLFAELDRRSFSMVTRVDWTFSPTLSLQLFAQPLLSSGDYVQYKQLAAARSYDFHEFPSAGGAVNEVGDVACSGICDIDGTQHVDFDGDGTADYSFADRDFNVRSLVGNAVVRWEYKPGSTIFIVWQRRQADRALVGDFDFGRDASALFDAPADNRFIIKVNYWLGL